MTTTVKPPAAAKPTTKKQAKAIRKIALGTISELDRRGWVKGDLIENRVRVGEKPSAWDPTFMVGIWNSVDEATARVCLVGAASSAYNPFYPEDPGMEYSGHPDYEAFLRAVVAELPMEFRSRVKNHDAGDWQKKTSDVANAIAIWNDRSSRTLKQVKTVLQRVADKHAPVAKAEAA